MRRRHMWGVGTGVAALVAATLVGPTALVANAATPAHAAVAKSAHTVVAKKKPGDDRRNDDRRHGDAHDRDHRGHHGHQPPPRHHHHHHYPPHCDYALSVDTSSHGGRHRPASIKVKVSYNGWAAEGVKVGLYVQGRDGSWKLVDTKTADRKGSVVFSYNVRRDTVVKAVVASGKGGRATSSKSVTVKSHR